MIKWLFQTSQNMEYSHVTCWQIPCYKILWMPVLYMVKNWLNKLTKEKGTTSSLKKTQTNPTLQKRHQVHLKLRVSLICRWLQDGAILGKCRTAAFTTPSVNTCYWPQLGQGTGISWLWSGPVLSLMWSCVITRSPRAKGWLTPNQLAVGVELLPVAEQQRDTARDGAIPLSSDYLVWMTARAQCDKVWAGTGTAPRSLVTVLTGLFNSRNLLKNVGGAGVLLLQGWQWQ